MKFINMMRRMFGTDDGKAEPSGQADLQYASEQPSDDSRKAIELINKLDSLKQFILVGEQSDAKPFVWKSGETDNEFLADCREVIKNIIIERIGREQYDTNIDRMDAEVAQLYRESDYHMARAEWLDAELRYYKEANNPSGLGGNQLMNMWKRVQETRRVFEEIEREIQSQQQN